jgi:N-acetyl sugar amidotransferase
MINRTCLNCLMDTTDSKITFNDKGVCSHCLNFEIRMREHKNFLSSNPNHFEKLISKIKKSGKNQEYDCLLGISGGLDSTYLLHIAALNGLRVLAVHVDGGWNSEIAVKNIFNICKKLNVDLHTEVIDWQTMKELQRAYMFSSLPNLDVPQDHAFIFGVYYYAKKYNIKYILNGSNFSTEGILPTSWVDNWMDVKQIKYIYKKFGRGLVSLKKYPMINYFQYLLFSRSIKRINLLNYINYTKEEAMNILINVYDWKYYGGKHFESRFTKYFQGYYLPKKFGYDKRKPHFSSLIVTNQMTRNEALKFLNDEDYFDSIKKSEESFIMKKLDLVEKDLDFIYKLPNKSYLNYPNSDNFFTFVRNLIRLLK